MDLQGSLIDTKLRIHPSDYIISYLKSQPVDDNTPINIVRIVNGKDYKPQQKEIVKETAQFSVHLSNEDIENLNKINALYVNKDDEVQNAAKIFEEHLQKNMKNAVVTPTKSVNEDEKTLETEDKEDLNNIDKSCIKETKLNSNESTKRSKEECNEKLKSDCNEQKSNRNNDKEEIYLTTSDLDWLYQYLQKLKSEGKKDVPYLNQLLKDAEIKTPDNQIIKRNPVLEARCVKLRAQQEAREYRKMTKSVDNVRMRYPEDSISFQLKQVNRHLIAIGQFIISIFAGFLFGFKGVEWMIGPLDFGFRLLLGVMCATIISLAEIYFLAKKLNEELEIPETVQLGGPPKFADSDKLGYGHQQQLKNKPVIKDQQQQLKNKTVNKEHQD